MRILLIENDRVDMRAVARMLAALPRAVDLHWVEDGAPALGDLRDHPFLRVFIFTASAHEDDRYESAEHFPAGYITKQSISEDGAELRALLTETWRELTEQA